MHSSAALKMTGIWTNTIGYDPYAAEGEGGKKDTGLDDGDSGMDQFKGLLKLAAAQNGVRCCAVWGALALTAPPAHTVRRHVAVHCKFTRSGVAWRSAGLALQPCLSH
jgi:hypothetical protein